MDVREELDAGDEAGKSGGYPASGFSSRYYRYPGMMFFFLKKVFDTLVSRIQMQQGNNFHDEICYFYVIFRTRQEMSFTTAIGSAGDKFHREFAMDTLYRRWLILGMIPRHGNTITVARIVERLVEITNLDAISTRSVQRDLEELSGRFPIVSKLEGRTLEWSWMEGKQITLPAMDPHTALTFQLVNSYMSSMLPKSSVRYLQPYFRNAAEVLESNPEFPLSPRSRNGNPPVSRP